MDKEELKKVFNAKRESSKTPKGFKVKTFQDFETWFQKSDFEKGCHYCGTTNSRSFELYNLQINNLRPNGTRGGKRGKRLELDRKDPNKSYDELDNLVWCCYWCNNAKSNFFSVDEFMPIAKAIGEVIKNIK
jgi:hypothetical protein